MDWQQYEIGTEEKGKFYDLQVKSGRFKDGYTYYGCWFDGLYFSIMNSGRTDRGNVMAIRESVLPADVLAEAKEAQNKARNW